MYFSIILSPSKNFLPDFSDRHANSFKAIEEARQQRHRASTTFSIGSCAILSSSASTGLASPCPGCILWRKKAPLHRRPLRRDADWWSKKGFQIHWLGQKPDWTASGNPHRGHPGLVTLPADQDCRVPYRVLYAKQIRKDVSRFLSLF